MMNKEAITLFKSKRKSFHGDNKVGSFFEGWYLKHQIGRESVSFIPAFHIDEEGKSSASIQIVTNDEAYNIDYSANEFYASTDSFNCKIGKSVFSSRGIYLDIKTEEIKVTGRIRYGELQPLTSDIMGPFRFLPFMQCNHGVISMQHELIGTIELNGKKIDFNGGTGYIEKDWGNSFPESYFWTQCNWMAGTKGSIMLSVAQIPFLNKQFRGCICNICHDDKQYRLATYYGVRVVRFDENEILLHQGKYWLQVKVLKHGQVSEKKPVNSNLAVKLKAPQNGAMSRKIKERLSSEMQFRFWEKKKLIFDLISSRASMEQMY